MGRILEVVSTIAIAVTLSLAYEWRLASFLIVTFPLLAFGAFCELEVLNMKSFGVDSIADAEEEKAAEVAAEALGESGGHL